MKFCAVIDTNVIVSALLSKKDDTASHNRDVANFVSKFISPIPYRKYIRKKVL
jgi:predicted nucleic acid-binding protein